MANSSSKITLILLAFWFAAGCAKKSDQTSPAKVEPKLVATKKTEAPEAQANPSKSEVNSSDPLDLAKTLQADSQAGAEQPAAGKDLPAAALGDNKSAPLSPPNPALKAPQGPAPISNPVLKPSDSRPLPVDSTIVPGGNPAPLAQETCPVDSTPLTPNQEKYCTALFTTGQKDPEKCILQKITDLIAKLKAENREPVEEALQWVMNRSKYECPKAANKDVALEVRLHEGLRSAGLNFFPESSDLIHNFINAALKKFTASPAVSKPNSVVATTIYHIYEVTHFGSRNFRQPDNAINYSVDKTIRKIDVKLANSEYEVPLRVLQGGQKENDLFSGERAYSFGLEMKSSGFYPLTIKDDLGDLNLDYQIYEGSVDGLKKGDSAKIVLTKESWLKVIEFETKKIAAKEFGQFPSSSVKIDIDLKDPTTARTCSIGKGYFLGSHAIACKDPDYRLRLQILIPN